MDDIFEGTNPVIMIKRQCDKVLRLTKDEYALRQVYKYFAKNHFEAHTQATLKLEEAQAAEKGHLLMMCERIQKETI